MIKELDSVVLTEDLPERGLQRGDLATVVLIHAAGGYEIEFMKPARDTVRMAAGRP
ncbi:MAG: DUF4926 domain-containing protein [Gammaproteobacteria bacterium]